MVTEYFGVPGCGKTTMGTCLAQKELRKLKKGKSKYKHVLTNFYCEGCEKINFLDIGVYEITDSFIVLDELTIDADNRDFKNFKKSSVEGWMLHRHYFNDIVYLTQEHDGIDKKIRSITQVVYHLTKGYVFPFVKGKRIFRTISIDENTRDIIYGYRFANLKECLLSIIPFLNKFLGKIRVTCFAPKWWKYFNSFDRPLDLKPFNYEMWHERGFDNE